MPARRREFDEAIEALKRLTLEELRWIQLWDLRAIQREVAARETTPGEPEKLRDHSPAA